LFQRKLEHVSRHLIYWPMQPVLEILLHFGRNNKKCMYEGRRTAGEHKRIHLLFSASDSLAAFIFFACFFMFVVFMSATCGRMQFNLATNQLQ